MANSSIFVGVDPDANGSICVLQGLSAEFLLFTKNGKILTKELADNIKEFLTPIKPQLVVLELPMSLPKQGRTSILSTGKHFGWCFGLLHSMDLPILLQTPKIWQKGLVYKRKEVHPKTSAWKAWCNLAPSIATRFKESPKYVKETCTDSFLMAWHARRVS